MKKILICLLIIVAVLALGVIWYRIPVRMLATVDAEDVGRITIFNGTNGEEAEITDREEIEHIVNNLKTVTMKRRKISVGYSGYHLRVTVYDNAGKKVHGWSSFIVNAAQHVRKDPFFYEVVDGVIDFEYLESVMTPQERRNSYYVSAEEASKMTTEALVETVLNYPYLSDIYAFNTLQQGIASVSAGFPALPELLSRPDANKAIQNYLKNNNIQYNTNGDNLLKAHEAGVLQEYINRSMKNKTEE